MTWVEIAPLVPLALGAGWLIGAIGIGGVLLIPAITAVTALDLRTAMATALFSFVFTGLAGTVQFHRRRTLDWGIALPVCIAAAVFAFAGARLGARTDVVILNAALAVIMIGAGLYSAIGAPMRPDPGHGARAHHYPALAAIGIIAGLGSGLTGVGGPALSVPIMMLAGYSPLVAVGTGQALQVAAALSGTIANLGSGAVHLELALLLSVFQGVGVMFGARFAHHASHRALRRLVAILCVIVGAVLLFRTPAAYITT